MTLRLCTLQHCIRFTALMKHYRVRPSAPPGYITGYLKSQTDLIGWLGSTTPANSAHEEIGTRERVERWVLFAHGP